MSEEDINSPSEEENEIDSIHHPRQTVLPSREIAKQFIDAYRNHSVLWDPSHMHYRSKFRRAKALDEMVPILQQCDPSANRELVRKQINVLRTNYRKVKLLHLKSKAVINGAECQSFKPNWRYHELQKFLDGVVDVPYKETADDHDGKAGISDQNSSSTVSRKEPMKRRYTRAKNDSCSDSAVIQIVDEAANEMFKLIGTNVALKLTRMSEDQRCHAELLIHKIVNNALRGRLNDATDVMDLPLVSDGKKVSTDNDGDAYCINDEEIDDT